MDERYRIIHFVGNGPMEPSARPFQNIRESQLDAFEEDEYTRMKISQESGDVYGVDDSKAEIHEIREERSRRQ